jgi:hypothetical protein
MCCIRRHATASWVSPPGDRARPIIKRVSESKKCRRNRDGRPYVRSFVISGPLGYRDVVVFFALIYVFALVVLPIVDLLRLFTFACLSSTPARIRARQDKEPSFCC